MKIEAFIVGDLGVNCYVVNDEDTKEALVIDPGANADEIITYIKKEGLQVKYVVNTHGHADHIGANQEVLAATGATLGIHEKDLPMLTDAKKKLSLFCGTPVISPKAGLLLKDGDKLKIGQVSLDIIYTPGHSPGGICLYTGQVLFSGDSLFAESIGRCDFPGGDMQQLVENIKKKLLCLPDETIVYPGHGPSSKIGRERLRNPYLV